MREKDENHLLNTPRDEFRRTFRQPRFEDIDVNQRDVGDWCAMKLAQRKSNPGTACMKCIVFVGMAFAAAFAAIAHADQNAASPGAAPNDQHPYRESEHDLNRAIDDAARATKPAIDSAKEAAINAIEKAR